MSVEAQEYGLKVLKIILEKLQVEFELETLQIGDSLTINIKSTQPKLLIGHNGDNLRNIESLLNSIIVHKYGKELAKHFVSIDIENYKRDRQEKLMLLANNSADRAIQTKNSYRLRAMNAFERRVVHMTLQDRQDVYTESEGTEPNRYIVIFPKN